MTEPLPGEWPDISGPYYRYLLGVARRRLTGREHHAEDVVSRAMTRWLKIPRDHPSARIETVIASEAMSLLRSEGRHRQREARVTSDASSPMSRPVAHDQDSLDLLRWQLARTCDREGITMSRVDLEVLELLFAGHTLAETARLMGVERHHVKRSRARWQRVLRCTLFDHTPLDS